MNPTTAYQLATARVAELQTAGDGYRLAAGATRAQKQRRADDRLTRFAQLLGIRPVRLVLRISLFAPRSTSAPCE
jgi:hypothetical protein